MTRRGRTALNLATALSLLLCLACLTASLFSIAPGKEWAWTRTIRPSGHTVIRTITLRDGRLAYHAEERAPSPPSSPFAFYPAGGREESFNLINIATFTAIAPAVWLLDALIGGPVARRRRTGHCPTCGYDLRATRTRCPECGTVPTNPI